jgi:hypothetical protein
MIMTGMPNRVGVAAVVLAGLALAGCDASASPESGSGSHNQCSGTSIDFAAGAHGAATPRKALAAYLRTPPPGLPAGGWQRESTVPGGVVFRSGAGKVDLVRVSDGSWLVDEYTVCR